MRHSDQGDERKAMPEEGVTVLSNRDRDALLAMLDAPAEEAASTLRDRLAEALEEDRRLPTDAR